MGKALGVDHNQPHESGLSEGELFNEQRPVLHISLSMTLMTGLLASQCGLYITIADFDSQE